MPNHADSWFQKAKVLRKSLFLVLIFLIAPEAKAIEPLEGKIIKRITVITKRTDPTMIIKEIILKENQPYRKVDVEETKKILYEMRLFKSVKIESKYDKSLGGVDVTLTLDDGWFILPIPFYGISEGGQMLSLMLVEGNYFKQGESISMFGSYNDDGQIVSVGGSIFRYSLNVRYYRVEYVEYEFSDGGFNSSGLFRPSSSEDDLSQVGEIVNSYNRKNKGVGGSFGVRHSRRLKSRFSLNFNNISYPDPSTSIPDDAGDQNFATVNLSYKKGDDTGPGNFAGSLGAIFGLGLADVDDKIRTLKKSTLGFRSDLSVSNGNKLLGSDFYFSRFAIGATGYIEFPKRHRLALGIRAATGINLPHTQLIATNRFLGLKGNYVKEFRGDSGIGSSLSFTFFASKSKLGRLVSMVFIENGIVWDEGESFNQPGIGASIYYKFWRFPLPLGLGYTYSINDKDSQFSFAIGAGF
jgi:outer membrane protein assembly factor BamA